MNKADSRPDQPDKKQWTAFFGVLVVIGITIAWELVKG